MSFASACAAVALLSGQRVTMAGRLGPGAERVAPTATACWRSGTLAILETHA